MYSSYGDGSAVDATEFSTSCIAFPMIWFSCLLLCAANRARPIKLVRRLNLRPCRIGAACSPYAHDPAPVVLMIARFPIPREAFAKTKSVRRSGSRAGNRIWAEATRHPRDPVGHAARTTQAPARESTDIGSTAPRPESFRARTHSMASFVPTTVKPSSLQCSLPPANACSSDAIHARASSADSRPCATARPASVSSWSR